MWHIGKRYLDFFKECKDERYMILMGGRRSGKTTNTFLYMYALSRLTTNMKYTTLCYQYPQLAKTMADFEKSIGYKLKRTKEGYSYRDDRGNLFLFDHCDDTSKALGNDCDWLFINESVNIPEEIADNYMLGCSSRIMLNFNPIRHSWHERYQNEVNLLKTTFKDNPYLPQSQVDAFERLKTRAELPTATPLDKFNYQVYYCGEYSDATGSIFTNMQSITYNEYCSIDAEEYFGMDFGFRDGGDPTSIVGVKIKNRTIYAHCYLYDNTLERLNDLMKAMEDCGINSTIFADYGGMGRSRMDDLIRNGYTMANAIKPKIYDNISNILSFEGGLRVTQNSDAMIRELAAYEMIDGKLSEKNNHSIDALRYAFNSAVSYNAE
jgi:phage terminase large subunit